MKRLLLRQLGWGICMFIFVALSSCKLGGKTTPTQSTKPETIYTAAAKTMEAQQTQMVFLPTSTIPATASIPTQTLPVQTVQIQATSTPIPSAVPNPMACDRLAFVEDVTIPDGTVLLPGQKFTKTWRLMNAGSCTWNSSYELVFISGQAMGGPSALNMTWPPVDPGKTINVSVELISPDEPGQYRGNWMLRNASGLLFGGGVDGKAYIWVDIRVALPTPTQTPTLVPTQTSEPTATPTPEPTTASSPG